MRLNKIRKDNGLEPVSARASAYCYARNRLPLDLLTNLIDLTIAIAETRAEPSWRWHDRDVYLVDGFMVRAPDTDANQLAYPQSTSQEPGLGYPIIRALTLTSLATKVVAHFEYGPMDGKGNGELGLFRKTFEFLKENQIIVGDSHFDSYYDMAVLSERNIDCVFGINGTREDPFADQDVHQTSEVLKTLRKPPHDSSRISRDAWLKLPESIRIRIIVFQVQGRSDRKVLVTTLLDQEKYPTQDIADLYGLRWEAELDIRCIKTVMDMVELRCQTPEGLQRELAVNVLAYNLIAILLCDTAEAIEVHPRQISFSHARDTFIHFGAERMTASDME